MSQKSLGLKLNLRQKLFTKLYYLPSSGRIIGIQKCEHLGVTTEEPAHFIEKWCGDTVFDEVRSKTVVYLVCDMSREVHERPLA